MVKLSKKLLSVVGRTNAKYQLMNEGDRVLLGLSGGKDSLTLAHALNHRRRVVPFAFDFLAVTVDYGDGTDFTSLINHCKEHDIPHIVHKTNIYEVAKDTIRENSSYCSYFSRMRRGALYRVALEKGYGKLALGHHLDDAVESFFMNFLYNGALAMPTLGDEACPGFNFAGKMPRARAETKKLLYEMEQNNKQLFTSLKAAFEHIHESTFFDNEKLRV